MDEIRLLKLYKVIEGQRQETEHQATINEAHHSLDRSTKNLILKQQAAFIARKVSRKFSNEFVASYKTTEFFTEQVYIDFLKDKKNKLIADSLLSIFEKEPDSPAACAKSWNDIDPQLCDAVHKKIESLTKLFVGGLSWETTEKELREHFTTFGEIESINIKTDLTTGRSRGFAFIVFSKAEALNKAMAHGDHVINNKKVDPKKAKAQNGKIFVGGLTSELSDDDIKNFFSQFGTIVDVEMPFDKTKNLRKGFCFITFESEQVANELLKTSKQTINNKEVEVKKATPRLETRGIRGLSRGVRGGRGGRGRAFGSQAGWGQGYGQGGYGGGYGGGYDGYADSYGYGSSYDGGYSGGRGGARGKGTH